MTDLLSHFGGTTDVRLLYSGSIHFILGFYVGERRFAEFLIYLNNA